VAAEHFILRIKCFFDNKADRPPSDSPCKANLGGTAEKASVPIMGRVLFLMAEKNQTGGKRDFLVKAGSKPCAGIPGGDAFDLKGTEI
jgi:hypothetical protein